MKDLVIQNLDRTSKLLKRALTRTIAPVVAFLLCAASLSAQNGIKITGRVTDDNGAPVAAASVQLKAGSRGVTTDDRGNFELTVPAKSTLVISAVGFSTREIAVKNGAAIAITLARATSQELEQVVVVGYGTQKKRDVTGSVISIGEKALREVPVANLQAALQGRVAGLEIQSVGTGPGAGAQIRIRGMKSILGSNDPLVVLDGIPFEGSYNDINPDDVASVDVLKDASATAIYGSRGANGVILITTKRGKSGETRVSYSGYYGISSVANKYPVFNGTEYQAMRNISPYGAGYLPGELNSIAKGKSTDWQDLMYKNSYKTDQNISVSGGNAGSTYALGGGYYKENSVLPGINFTRYSLRANIDSRIGRHIRVGLSSLNQVSVSNGSQFVNPMFWVLAMSPLMPAYDSLGNVTRFPAGSALDNNQYSPLLLKNNNGMWADQVRRLTTTNSVYGEYEFIPGLKYRVNLGLTFRQEEDDQFQASDDTSAARLKPSYFRYNQGNTAYVNNSSAWGYTVENLLTYDKTIKKSRISFTGLYSIQESHSHNTSVRKDSITDNAIQFYNLASSSTTPAPVLGGGETSSSIISYMGRINYVYDNKYMITITGRMDGSSRLADGHKWHSYPAVSVGWNILDESFMHNVKVFSSLKLRAGVGQTSNQSVSPYASLGLVSNSNGIASPANVIRYNYGPTVVSGYNVANIPNTGLGWEYTKTVNIGVDFGVLNNRISGAIEYYQQHTSNVLYNVTLPPTSGVTSKYNSNIGEIQNNGMELSVTTLNIESRHGFSWSTDFNLFFNRNKLLSLYNGFQKDVANQLFVGNSLTSVYDYKKLGIWQKNEAAQAASFGAVPGQIKFEDHGGPNNGKPDGKIDINDQYIIGNGDAKLQGGMTNRFSYKGFDLSIVMYARFGGLLVSQVHQPSSSYLTVLDGRRNGIKVDYWTPTNPTNWFPEPSASISSISTAWTTLGYYSGTFVRIRSINLGYTFSPAVLKRLGAQNIRPYVTVDNVATLFSPYFKQTGIDPVATNAGSSGVSDPGNLRGNGSGNGMLTISASTPATRSFSIGANITF